MASGEIEHSPQIAHIRAEVDGSRVAVLGPTFPLLLAGGGSEAEDHPGFARAASALRRWQRRLVVIQDDINAIAVGGSDASEPLEPWLLPRGEGGRRRFEDALGNKRHKLDLEAAIVLPDGRLVAFGSGSTLAREQLVIAEGEGRMELRRAPDLYAALRRQTAFSGSELNIEGAVVQADRLRLFQRGNGRLDGGVQPISAVGDVSLAEFLAWLDAGAPAPSLRRILCVDLGDASGVPFGFTDATLLGNGDVAFLACAERSPDVTRDGEVLACRFGTLREDSVRLIDIVDEHGAPCTLKLEGIEARPEADRSFDVVADMDCHDRPALGALLTLNV
jgi:hypothetical protein